MTHKEKKVNICRRCKKPVEDWIDYDVYDGMHHSCWSRKQDFFMYFIIGIILVIFGLILALFFYSIILDGIEDSCKTYKNLKLESVNGIYDKDTGLFASGSVSEKTLLFSNGLIMTLKSWEVKEVNLMLGKKYNIKKCVMKSKRIEHTILR